MKRTRSGIALLMVSVGLVSCGLVGCSNPAARAPSAPSAPSGASQPPLPTLVVFKDPLTGLSTSDVRDARGHIVQFTTPTSSSGSMVVEKRGEPRVAGVRLL